MIPTIFLKRRCASRFSWIFGVKHESKNCLTLVYMAFCIRMKVVPFKFKLYDKLQTRSGKPGNPHQSASQVVLGIVHQAPLKDGWLKHPWGKSSFVFFFNV